MPMLRPWLRKVAHYMHVPMQVWAWRVHDQLSSSCLVFSLLCMFCVLIPAFLWHKYGLHWYCRYAAHGTLHAGTCR